MIWFPEEEIYLKPMLNKSEQLQALDFLIQKNVSVSDYYKNVITKEYVGKLDSDGFKMQRVLHNEINSYNPIIEGKFINEKTIGVQFRLNYYAQVFQLAFMGLCFAALFIALQENIMIVAYAAVGLLLFSYVLMILSFNSERIKTRRRIIEVLKAEEINQNEF